jgi:hypothetical protein
LAGAFIAYYYFDFNPDKLFYTPSEFSSVNFFSVMMISVIVLVAAVGTAVILSNRNANKRGEKLWNASVKHMVMNMAVPLVAGGLLIIILTAKGMIGLAAPLTLLFYGIALYNAGQFTFKEVKSLGMIEIALGLFSSYFVGYGLLCWAIGFGAVHIVYGIYMHYKYEQ